MLKNSWQNNNNNDDDDGDIIDNDKSNKLKIKSRVDVILFPLFEATF